MCGMSDGQVGKSAVYGNNLMIETGGGMKLYLPKP
jgi:hypothetical protein